MELKDYLTIARRRWLLITLVTLGSIAVAIIFTLRATPMYESTTRLFISTSQAEDGAAYQGGLFSQQRVKSYADLLTGDEIARRVVESLGLNEKPRELSERITAQALPETVILKITVTDTAPKRAQRITAELAEQFVGYVQEIETLAGQETAPVKASIVDKATLSTEPVSPKPVRNVALAAVLGLLLGVGAAVLRETLDTSISSTDALTDATGGAPVLGSIRYDRETPKNPLITTLTSHAPRVEAFRVLRTNMQFINVDGAKKVFVISSAVPGEGKSTTACNLALALAQAGESVLLLEADLRRPRAAEYLKVEASVGVTSVLTGRIPFEAALQSAGAGLTFIAAGPIPPNPAELLQSEAMRKLIAEASQRFDTVLIDAPPLLPVTDAALLASQSDGAILVTRHGKTTHDEVVGATERIRSVDARLLGSIVNMTPPAKRGGYGYGYGYGYAPEQARGRKARKAKKARKAAQHTQGVHPVKPGKLGRGRRGDSRPVGGRPGDGAGHDETGAGAQASREPAAAVEQREQTAPPVSDEPIQSRVAAERDEREQAEQGQSEQGNPEHGQSDHEQTAQGHSEHGHTERAVESHDAAQPADQPHPHKAADRNGDQRSSTVHWYKGD